MNSCDSLIMISSVQNSARLLFQLNVGNALSDSLVYLCRSTLVDSASAHLQQTKLLRGTAGTAEKK